jgi:uncharacterized damage-inducible protein DinB
MDNQKQSYPRKAEMLERIAHARAALEETLNSLNPEQFSQVGQGEWSIKDHLAHLATWELGVAELLRRRPRFAAMQVEEAVSQGKSEDEINDLIYHQHVDLPQAEIMHKFRDAHLQLLAALDELDDEDLSKPYAAYVPDGSGNPQRPVVQWIIGNTYQHFDEHHGYILRILQESHP